MNQEVAAYIDNLPKWQGDISSTLRDMIHETIPEAEERIQYKKPHFLKNGHYAAVISPSKDAIAFMILNAITRRKSSEQCQRTSIEARI